MELKEGMYIRTKEGIRKIEDIWDGMYDLNRSLHNRYPEGHCLFKEDIEEVVLKEPSFNLIDLIEPMDLMYIDILPDDCGGIVVLRIAETLNELNDFKERFASGNCILKGIFTKEQIKVNTYWVGD